MAKDLSHWTKQDIARLLGLTEREVERLAREEKIRRAYWLILGRRPLAVFIQATLRRYASTLSSLLLMATAHLRNR